MLLSITTAWVHAARCLVFITFRLQSQIAVWALKRMRACLIRGRGIDLQGFIQYLHAEFGLFSSYPPLGQGLSSLLIGMQAGVPVIMASLVKKY